jgi:predicted nucleic acid-binding protein
MHLLRAVPRGQETLLQLIGNEAVQIAALDGSDVRRIDSLMRKYKDVPMDVADAALVRVAERDDFSRILTFDAHFRIYRLPNRGRFIVLGLPLLK